MFENNYISEPFIIEPLDKDTSKLTYLIDNSQHISVNEFIDILKDKNCFCKKYWQSKFDRNIIEESNPIIYDAYNCIIISVGDKEAIEDSVNEFEERQWSINHLEKCLNSKIKLKEDIDYEKIAIALLNKMEWY